MRFAYYPGCTMKTAGAAYDASLRAVAEALSIELREIEGWVCCGSSAAHSADAAVAGALPIHNLRLAVAERVLAPCAECYARFGAAIREAPDGEEFAGRVVHPLQVFREPAMLDAVSSRIKRDLSSVRPACYYGCLLVRPPGGGIGDDPERPKSMDLAASRCGASPVDWEHKTECCGAALSLCEPGVAKDLSLRIVNAAEDAGANCLLVACQMCHTNLELCQEGRKRKTPVLYFTELIGLALGMKPRDLGFGSHLVSSSRILGTVTVRDG